MKNKRSCQKGFTLIEIAIVMLIMGLFVGAVFSFLTVQRRAKEEQVTVQKEQKIASALAYYAQMHHALPCPGLPVPQITPTDPVGNQERPGCSTVADRNGIVPFRVLGLTQDDVTDGFGNPFSYTVSTAGAVPSNQVEAFWRMSAWSGSQGKATFCGAQDVTPLYVFTAFPGTAASRATRTQVDSGAGELAYAPFSSTAGSSHSGDSNYYPNYFAYVLVSHGQNGAGSYSFCQGDPHATPGCNNNRKPITIDTSGQAEFANANMSNDDNRYNVMRNTSLTVDGTGRVPYFDDIVLWRTQDRVITEFSNDSCAAP